jgi:2-polyprenyl-3-methyl-5-hydroxy-6-metoxy-1,4-benzoquinol methylase
MFRKILLFAMSLQEPACWIIDRQAKTVLDVGSGPGLPMELLKVWHRFKLTVGVDVFKPYLNETKKKKIHDKYVLQDIRKLDFPDKSYDVVIALQVIEHLEKKEAWKLIAKMEKIAKRQVILATPIGYMYHHHTDNNPHQEHKSEFLPEELEKKGYKILKFGRKEILGEHGIVHTKNAALRKIYFFINFLLTPVYYFVQPFSNYHVYAYKNMVK